MAGFEIVYLSRNGYGFRLAIFRICGIIAAGSLLLLQNYADMVE